MFENFGVYGIWIYFRIKFLKNSLVKIKIPQLQHFIYLRPRNSDYQVFSQIFCGNQYNFDLEYNPKVIVDAGANIGLSTVFFANKYPDAMVIAVEPETDNFRILQLNTEQYKNVVVIQRALWHQDGFVMMHDSGLGDWGFQVASATSKADNTVKIPTITVPDLISSYHIEKIDLFKIDIESAEKYIFGDSSRWIDYVNVIAIELHDFLLPGCSRTFYRATLDFDTQYNVGENVILMKSKLGSSAKSVGSLGCQQITKPMI